MNQDITFIIPTYNRPDILTDTIWRILSNARYTMGRIRILVGNDGEGAAFSDGKLLRDHDVTILSGPKRGLGANLNMLLKAAKTDLVFQMDDDHHLKKALHLDEHARFLMEDSRALHGWVRLMFGHSSERSQWPRDYYHFKAQLYKSYWRVIPDKELWVPSNRPHLKHIGFHQYYGLYDEEVKLGETEYEFCNRWHKMASGGPSVFIPFNPPDEDTWEHVGESWQHTEHDRRVNAGN